LLELLNHWFGLIEIVDRTAKLKDCSSRYSPAAKSNFNQLSYRRSPGYLNVYQIFENASRMQQAKAAREEAEHMVS